MSEGAALLDVSSDDIGALDDKQLRELIARLCEAEVERKDLPRTAVTWGGHQDAPDGGVDIRVELPADPGWCGDIPRTQTIFQSKASEMTASKILTEMRSDDTLRPAIAEVLSRGGAYVIVSNRDNATDQVLQKRREVMEETVRTSLSDHQGLLDFYDRSRLASWTRSHPGVVIWLRNAIGRPLQGWMGRDELKKRHDGLFLEDDTFRLHTPQIDDSEGMGTQEGIASLRAALQQEGACVRLAGLSGVGKTRLVQALFDETVGTGALPAHELVYADLSDDPIPTPSRVCNQLHSELRSSIVVVDNCPPDLHAKLTKFVKECKSRIRLLTVEYDVRDDDPEETSVFRMEPASDDLIERLVEMRFPGLQPSDPRTIAEFSGGNARIALALAKTVENGQKLTGLRSDELFRRLFHQRHDPSESLLKVARCCSLVYSFQLEFENGFSPELLVLAELAGVDPDTFYQQTKELKKRDLLQKRSVWGAILPHAIANRLAKDALEFFPRHRILQAFQAEGRERLLKSFARRLGYLNDSEEAKEIARSWIAPGGMLGDLASLDGERLSWFERIAPIVETESLEMIERAMLASTAGAFLKPYFPARQVIEELVRLLAFRPENFAKAVDLLRRMLHLLEDQVEFKASLDRFKALFALRLSGTMAPPTAKLDYLRRLFAEAGTDIDRQVALSLAECGLAADHLHHTSYDFGGRVGAYGYTVKGVEEYRQWYRDLLEFGESQILSNTWSAMAFKEMLGKHFQILWVHIGLKDDLEGVVSRLIAAGGWNEGFNAVRKLIRHGRNYGGERYTSEDFEQLEAVRDQLFPKDLISYTRLVIDPDYRESSEEIDELEAVTEEQIAQVNLSIESELLEAGRRLGAETAALDQLLPELLSQQSPKAMVLFLGVLSVVESGRGFWEWFEQKLRDHVSQRLNPYLVAGVLDGILARDPSFGREVLDRMVEHPRLGTIFPSVQFQLPIDDDAHRRLLRALQHGAAPVSSYQRLGFRYIGEQYDDGRLIEILKAICARDIGAEVVLNILGLRFHGLGKNAYHPSQELIEFTQDFLLTASILDAGKDYKISTLVRVAFGSSSSFPRAVAYGRRLAIKSNDSWYFHGFTQTFSELAKVQPFALLDGYLLALDARQHRGCGFSESPSLQRRDSSQNPFDRISDAQFEEWCKQDPEPRSLGLAKFVRLYQYDAEMKRVVWMPFALRMISSSQQPIALLDLLYGGFSPSGCWSGSYADIMECYLPLLEDLRSLGLDGVAEWATEKAQLLMQDIREWRDRDHQRNSSALLGFE